MENNMKIMERQELEQWLENNKLDNGKVRNNEIIHQLNLNLQSSLGYKKDDFFPYEEKIDLILSYYDKDFFKKQETGLDLKSLALYYEQMFESKVHDPQSSQQFQARVQELFDISQEKNKNSNNNSKTKYEQLFESCAKEAGIENKKENQKMNLIQSFFEDFPEILPDNSQQTSDFSNVVESAIKYDFSTDSLMKLKEYGFSLYEPDGCLIEQAMEPINHIAFSNDSQKDNDIVDLLIKEGNEVNYSSLVNAIESEKSHKIFEKLLDHLSEDVKINRISRNVHTVRDPLSDGRNPYVEEFHIFDKMLDNKTFDGIDKLEPFFKKGMRIPYNDAQLAFESMKSRKNCQFIDDMLSSSCQEEKHHRPFDETISKQKFAKMIKGFIKAEYSDPNIVNVLNQHGMLNCEKLKQPKAFQSEMQEIRDMAKQYDTRTNQAIVHNLETKLEANKAPSLLQRLKQFTENQQQETNTHSKSHSFK